MIDKSRAPRNIFIPVVYFHTSRMRSHGEDISAVDVSQTFPFQSLNPLTLSRSRSASRTECSGMYSPPLYFSIAFLLT